jgi:hypothetical protein
MERHNKMSSPLKSSRFFKSGEVAISGIAKLLDDTLNQGFVFMVPND